MSASEEMMRDQLDRIIAAPSCASSNGASTAGALAPYGDQAKRARSQLALVLIGLAKLKTCRSEFSEPQSGPTAGT